MRHPALALLLAFVWVSSAGCTASAELPSQTLVLPGPPDIKGQVTRLDPGNGRAVRFLVESDSEEEPRGLDKAWIRFGRSALVYLRQGKSWKRASVDRLKTGLQVEVWFEGPVLESYPVQAQAKIVAIVEAD